MNIRPLVCTSLAALYLVAFPACEKPAAPSALPPAVTPPQAPEKKAETLVSAEPTSFQAVSRHLDPGGWFYLYLSGEQIIRDIREESGALRKLLIDGSPHFGDEASKAEAGAVWEAMERFLIGSGLGDITGFGASSIAIEPGYYQTRTVLHHNEGRGTGFIWRLCDGNANALDVIGGLPANTALAASMSYTLSPMLEEVRRAIEPNEKLRQGYQDLVTRFEQWSGGLTIEGLVNGLGPRYSFFVTFDESKKIALPIPNPTGPLEISHPAFVLSVEVRDKALIERLETELAKAPMEALPDEGDFKVRRLTTPVPLYDAQPIVAWSAQRVTIASDEAVWRDSLAVARGEKAGLASTERFRKISKEMPDSAVSFGYMTPEIFDLIVRVQEMMLQNQPQGEPVIAYIQKKSLELSRRKRDAIAWSEKTSEGFHSLTRDDQGPTRRIVGLLTAPVAIGASAAVPAFTRARSNADGAKVLDDIRLLDAASDQWALEFNKAIGSQPTTDDLVKYLRVGKDLTKRLAAHPGATSFILREGLPPVVIPKVGDRITLPVEWHSRYGETLKPYLP